MPLIFVAIIYSILKIPNLRDIADILSMVYFYSALLILFLSNYVIADEQAKKVKLYMRQLYHMSFLLFFVWILLYILRSHLFNSESFLSGEFLLYIGFLLINLLGYLIYYKIIRWKPNTSNITFKIVILLAILILSTILLSRLYSSLSKVF